MVTGKLGEGKSDFDQEGRTTVFDFPNSGPVIVNVYCPNGGMDGG